MRGGFIPTALTTLLLSVVLGCGKKQQELGTEKPQELLGTELVGKEVKPANLEFRLLADLRDDASAFESAAKLVNDITPAKVAQAKELPAPAGFAWVVLSDSEAKRPQMEKLANGYSVDQNYAFFAARENKKFFVLTKVPGADVTITQADILDAWAEQATDPARWEVRLSLKSSGADKMSRLTAVTNRSLAILLDDQVLMYAVIQSPLREAVLIGLGTEGSLEDNKRRAAEVLWSIRAGIKKAAEGK
jgi:preprotein translocase subunit SecD